MKIPLLDLSTQLKTIETDVKAAINQVIDSTEYILGPVVAAFETKIAEYVGTGYAIGVSSGSDALLVSLMALGTGPGDLVITTPYSFFATAGCIARLGATPVFVDIDPDTYNLDPRSLRHWLETNRNDREKVRAIIPVHLYGQCADMDSILGIAREHHVPVIEDAAQAMGSSCPSREGVKRAGSMGLAGCFSFFPTKPLGALGDAGMVVTADERYAEKLRTLRVHGGQPKHYHALIGGNFRIDPIQAAALMAKLPHLDRWNAMRQERASYYDAHFDVSGIKKPALAYGRGQHVYHQYVISVPERRDELVRFLTVREIGCATYYPVPLHRQECFAYLGYRRGDLPRSEYAAAHTIALPMYPELTADMQDRVIRTVRDFYG